jgi:hypothetical protein
LRFYQIKITNPKDEPVTFPSLAGSGMPPGVITSQLTDGTINPAALNIEMDLIVYGAVAAADSASYLRIWGLSLKELSSAFNLNGMKIQITGGMAKGYPLADPQQQGVLVKGNINQAFGNWIGTDMTLDMYLRAEDFGSLDAPANYTQTWAKGEPLADMIARALKVVAPNLKQEITISSDRVANQDKPSVYSTLSQFAQMVQAQTYHALSPTDQGVIIASDGQTVRVFEKGSGSTSGAKQINFQDLLGQVTWIEPGVVQAKLVMRGDLRIGDVVKFPKGLVVTTTANAMSAFGGTGSSHPANALTFSGTFQIIQMQHWGNFRIADAAAWNTTINCAIMTDNPA